MASAAGSSINVASVAAVGTKLQTYVAHVIKQATSRVRANISYFKVNYTIMMLGILVATMLSNPSSIIWLALLTGIWGYLFVIRSEPLVISGRTISDREKLIGMSVLTGLVVFFLSNIATVVIYGLGIGFAAVVVHGVMRAPDVMFLDEGAAPAGDGSAGFFSFLAAPAPAHSPAGAAPVAVAA